MCSGGEEEHPDPARRQGLLDHRPPPVRPRDRRARLPDARHRDAKAIAKVEFVASYKLREAGKAVAVRINSGMNDAVTDLRAAVRARLVAPKADRLLVAAEALRRGLLNNDELEKASVDLEGWLERDQKKFLEEQKREAGKKK